MNNPLATLFEQFLRERKILSFASANGETSERHEG